MGEAVRRPKPLVTAYTGVCSLRSFEERLESMNWPALLIRHQALLTLSEEQRLENQELRWRAKHLRQQRLAAWWERRLHRPHLTPDDLDKLRQWASGERL